VLRTVIVLSYLNTPHWRLHEFRLLASRN